MNFSYFIAGSTQDYLFTDKKEEIVPDNIIQLLPTEKISTPLTPETYPLINPILNCLDDPTLFHIEIHSSSTSKEILQAQSCLQNKTKENVTQQCKIENKTKRVVSSPFHNYQKHLGNALRKLVIVPYLPDDEGYKRAAAQIWRGYLDSEVRTKKILHYVFNEKNEHKINERELQSCKLLPIYKSFEKSVIVKAKIYLTKLVIGQIGDQAIEDFLRSRRKMKNKENFKEYMINFRKELINGCLKKRSNV